MPYSTTTQLLQQNQVVEPSIESMTLITTHPISASKASASSMGMVRSKHVLDRNLLKDYHIVTGGKGVYLFTKDGRSIFDASSGAAVSCLGHGDIRVVKAICDQMMTGTPYLPSGFWACEVTEKLCSELIAGTEWKMSRAYLTGSGSEAMEATIKIARQYFLEKDKNTPRVNFICREQSYHGNTIGALGVSGFKARRAPYTPLFMKSSHTISSCNAYRQRHNGESDASFVARKAAELETKFQSLGPDTVIGFIAEPIVGAALGCVPCVPGYLRAMRDVCHKYGALFILDEVMCGMGRSGTLHAWQDEDVVPDLQTVAKGLGAGYQPVAAVLISEKVVNALLNGSGMFVHGQTYQGMPVVAAAALEVQRIVREDRLVDNVRSQGLYLEASLKALLSGHPNVGDIRGRGLFWGLEFVRDKKTKMPFTLETGVAQRVHETAISAPHNMMIYPGTGTVDGVLGDHIILAPPYIVTRAQVDVVVETMARVVRDVFEGLAAEQDL